MPNNIEIIYQHRERCERKGYPSGLKCTEILIEAQILMVADVVEANKGDISLVYKRVRRCIARVQAI